jgi:HEAT repeat protein
VSRALPALLVAQRDPSALVRRAAAEAWSERRGPHAAEALGALLSDADADVARTAADGLARLGDLTAARAALVEGYGLAYPHGRVAIANALSEIGVSLRDAVEMEARRRWARNLAALSSDSPSARAGAAEELGASGRTEAVARLETLLAASVADPRLASAALRGLGAAGDAAALPMIEQALGRADPDVAQAAALALARIGDPAATGPLARLAAVGSGPVNLAALSALDALPAAPEVSQALCGVALRTASPSMAARSARAAWTRNAECPAAAFASRAGRGDAAALAAIVELHPDDMLVASLAPRLVASLSDARASSDQRQRAAVALGQLGWGAAGPAVEARVRALTVRIGAARARWVPGRFAVDATALPADEPGRFALLLARAAAVPERAAGSEPSVPAWIDVTPDADASELGALLSALGRLHAPSASDLLRPAAHDSSPAIRAGAVEGLGHLGGEAPSPELVAALSDPDRRVSEAALRVLPRYGPRAVPPLAAARSAQANDPDWQGRVARALGETGSPDALAPLVAMLDGSAPGAAADAIAAIGAPGGADPLVAHLARKDASGRVEALDALAQLASKAAGAVIEDELLSERPELRVAAARAIGRLRYEPGSGRLEALRVDYDGRVRRATIEALAKLPSVRPVVH